MKTNLNFCLSVLPFLFASFLAQADESQWLAKQQFSGDLRYRAAASKESSDDERKFQQLRARIGLTADVNPDVKATLRLATASSAVSTNQTLGDSSSPGSARRSFGIDLAYLNWRWNSEGQLWAGRTANPFWSPNKSQIIFDADLAFEGLAVKWEPTWSEGGAFINLGGFMISENYSSHVDSVDLGVVGGDLGYVWNGSALTWTTHFGNYYFLNVQNSAITAVDSSARVDSFTTAFSTYKGNTVYLNDSTLPTASQKYLYQTEFVLMELGTELKFKFGPHDLILFGDISENTKVGDLGRAFEYGLSFKMPKLTFTQAFNRKESNSVLGAFTDSDLNGGGTDNRGQKTALAYNVTSGVQLTATHYWGTRGVDTLSRSYHATHLDLAASF